MNDDKSTGGTRHYDQPDASQAERRKMLKQDAHARTYFEIAQGDDGEALGRTPVTGNGAPPFAVPAWSSDAATLPPERPLGYDVNALPDMNACNWEPDAVGPSGEPADEA